MENEPNIAELAVAAWRLERWLDNLVAERKMAAKSSLRSIKKYLEASEIEIIDPVGSKFDPGLAIEVVNNEAEDKDESELIIIETNSPIIKQGGSVIQYGRVILGTDIKEQKSNSEIKTSTESTAEKDALKTNDDREDKDSSTIITSQYFSQKFEFYDQLDGYDVGIEVQLGKEALNASLRVYLMDKYNYKDFERGLNPSNIAGGYRQTRETDVIRVPYPGEWYVVICNDSWVWKDKYEVSFRIGWIARKKSDKTTQGEASAAPASAPSEDAEQKMAVGEQKDNGAQPGASEYPPIIKDSQEDTSAISEDAESLTETTVAISSSREKVEVTISEKAEKKLVKKNVASYYQEIARMAGLLGKPHGKGKK